MGHGRLRQFVGLGGNVDVGNDGDRFREVGE